jgi:hypothetical protein
MATTQVTPDWRSLLIRYLQYAQSRKGKVPPAATAAELDQLRQRAEQLDLTFAPAMVELFKVANGTGYDGLTIYGIGIDREDEFGRLDVFEANELVEERANDTLYGQWQDELFVRVAESGRFERRSMVTGNARETFDSCEALLVSVLAEEVDILDQRAARRKERARHD